MDAKIEGRVLFQREGSGSLAVCEGWNPDNLTREERQIIADELEKIAARLRRGGFLDHSNKVRRFKSKRQSRQHKENANAE